MDAIKQHNGLNPQVWTDRRIEQYAAKLMADMRKSDDFMGSAFIGGLSPTNKRILREMLVAAMKAVRDGQLEE